MGGDFYMSFIYVTEHGAVIKLNGGKIIIEKEKKTLFEIPKNTIDGLVLLSSVQITSQAIVEFLHLGIPVTWISSIQKFYGRLESMDHVNVSRQSKQVKMQDSNFYLKMAQKIIEAKIRNQQVILRRYNRRRNSNAVKSIIIAMETIANFIPKTIIVNRIMGYEGIAAKNYFSALGKMVSKDFAFEKRSKRPPLDMFNSMLSFGYSLLRSEVYTAINNAGLHPYFGFMHAMKEHHPTLASDLMEEWRPVLIDSMVMSLVSHNEIKTDCFESSALGGIYLNSVGRKIFINAYEKKMQTISENKYSYRHSLKMQAENYARALMAEDVRKYESFRIR